MNTQKDTEMSVETTQSHDEGKIQRSFFSSRVIIAITIVVAIGALCAYGIVTWQNNRTKLAQFQTQFDAQNRKITLLEQKISPDLNTLSTHIDNRINQLDTALKTQEQQIDALRGQLGHLTKQLSKANASGTITITAAEGEIAVLRLQLKQMRRDLNALNAQSTKQPKITAQDLQNLQKHFSAIAHRAISADQFSKAQNSGDRFTAWLRSQFSIRSTTPQAGDDTDAILSRIDAALAQGNLAQAMKQIENLSDAARNALANWTAQLQKHLDDT